MGLNAILEKNYIEQSGMGGHVEAKSSFSHQESLSRHGCERRYSPTVRFGKRETQNGIVGLVQLHHTLQQESDIQVKVVLQKNSYKKLTKKHTIFSDL